jgi:hypothetical protein
MSLAKIWFGITLRNNYGRDFVPIHFILKFELLIKTISIMEKKLKCRTSEFKSDITFNEWVVMFNVSRDYIQPTPYFQGNPKTIMEFDGYKLNRKKEPLSWRIGKIATMLVNSIKLPF